ncbi:MAG: hypothetical protein ABIY55_28220 [Kofleriaceae bacterium]
MKKIALLLVCATGIAWASGDWGSAKSKADELKSKADELVRDTPAQTAKIVTAACAASDDERGRAASAAASSVRGHVNDKYSELERSERDVIDKLEHVDDKDHKDDARRLADEVKSRWSKLGDQTRDARNGSERVVEYLTKGGNALRDHAGRCDAKDVSLDAGHAMCLIASGDTCKVVELSSASSSAVSKAKDRASRYKSQLEREVERKDKGEGSDLLKRLISSHSDFAKCKRFEVRVDCYKQCPDIDSDNRLRESSPSWREGC